MTRTNGKAKRKRLPRVYPTLDAAGDAAGKHVATESKSSVVSRRFSIYQNLDSTAHMAVARYDLENGKKSYRPFHPSGAGWSLGDPSGKLPLYKAPALASAMRVFFFEGEKCADIGCRLGLVCTTTAHGAMSPHKSDLSQLAGANEVVIVRDYDADGEKYETAICQLLDVVKPRPAIKLLRLQLENTGDDLEQWVETRPDTWTDEDCRRELDRLADEAPEWTPTTQALSNNQPPGDTGSADASSRGLSRFVRTDRGNAERLVAYHGRDFRHCGPWKKFMVWDECRWKLDDSGEVCRRAKSTARSILREAADSTDDDERKELAVWWKASESRRGLEAMIALPRPR